MTPLSLDAALSVAVGVGLAAACGLRVFVPLLVLSLGARAGTVPLADSFAWIASTPALIAFGTAALLEVVAYYVPWLDNALDLVATPVAVMAGVIASASVMVDLPPLLKWSIAVIGGGGVAGVIQGTTVLARAKSTTFTGGLANFIVSTIELVGSATAAIIALALPFVAIGVVVVVVVAVRRIARRVRGSGRPLPVP